MFVTPYQSTLVKGWNIFAQLSPGRLMSPALSLDSIMRSAARSAGCGDPGTPTFLEPLHRLLDSLNETGGLHPFGKFYVKTVITALVTNRLKITGLLGRHPEILNQPVSQPVIILGLPRTGTSFLFNLLAQDPTHRVLTNWEATGSQVPPEGSYVFTHDPRRRKGRHMIRFQNYLVPRMKDMHQFYLDGPEECTPLLMQEFATQALAGMFDVPSYSKWLDSASHTATYRFHKQALQTLQWKYPGERWLLKSPDHIAAIGAILGVHPDACIIHMHRDPVKSVASWASLNAAFRGIYTRSINTLELGSQILHRLATDVEAYLSQRKKCDSTRFLDLQYRDLTSDPVAAARRIYQRFNLVLSPEAEDRMRAFLAMDRKKKRGAHHYGPDDFGLTPQLIQQRFGGYIDTFNVPRED